MARMIMKVLCYVVACMVVFAPYAEASITCRLVVADMIPCLTYLRNGGVVSAPCCNGVRSLNAAAQTTPDRKAACVCLKNAYKAYTGINTNNAISLPGKCGVNIPYKLSPSTDCNRVH